MNCCLTQAVTRFFTDVLRSVQGGEHTIIQNGYTYTGINLLRSIMVYLYFHWSYYFPMKFLREDTCFILEI